MNKVDPSAVLFFMKREMKIKKNKDIISMCVCSDTPLICLEPFAPLKQIKNAVNMFQSIFKNKIHAKNI